jgi:hypothetical protein
VEHAYGEFGEIHPAPGGGTQVTGAAETKKSAIKMIF